MWFAFVDLAGTREVALAAGPICYREIAAYNAETHALLSAWDVKLIRTIDTAIRALSVPGAAPTPPTDTKSLKAMLRGVVAQKAARDAKAAQG